MENMSKCLNPVLLNLQKMQLELTCPICLKLLCTPTLFPCGHTSCRSCIVEKEGNLFGCPICKSPFHRKDLRPASHLEAIVNIHKSLHSIVSSLLSDQEPQVDFLDTKAPFGGSPDAGNGDSPDKTDEERKYGDGDGTQNAESVVKKRSYNLQSSRYTMEVDNESRNLEVDPMPPSKGVSKEESKVARVFAGDDISSRKKLKFDDMSSRDDGTRKENGIDLIACGFCHSTSVTEGTGALLHFLGGKPVMDDEASQANAVHVHEKCVEWAPQVFFSGDNAINLESELARASKIKCSSCGSKGAALGCLSKSCRKSFHVPCAHQVAGCRWDTENFLMLCPDHASNKLPCDRSKKTKNRSKASSSGPEPSLQGLNPSPMFESEYWTAPLSIQRDWLLCTSALTLEDEEILDEFTSLSGVDVSNKWKPDVTHVIAATDKRGACKRTRKVLMAILGGKWVLSVDWLIACIDARRPVPEEPYEISLDVHGTFDGPRNGRLRVLHKRPKLFAGLKFYLSGHFMPYYRRHLEDLVTAAGGSMAKSVNDAAIVSLVVYSTDPPQGSKPDERNEAIKKRKKEAEELAASIGCKVVAHTWILDTVASTGQLIM